MPDVPRLTATSRATLEQAKRSPLRRTHTDGPGVPPWPAPWQTLHALVARGLLAYDERPNRRRERMQEWTITDAGREALAPPPARPRRDTVASLRVPGGSTRFMQAGEWTEVRIPEPEAMKPSPGWTAAAQARHVETQDRRDQARRIARRARAA